MVESIVGIKDEIRIYEKRALETVKVQTAGRIISRRQRKSHFSARVWDSTEKYLETGRRDTRDLARSP